MIKFISELVDEHAIDAAFLWLLRDQAVSQPHYNANDIAELDGRIEAHLDGLRVHGEAGLEVVRGQLEEFGEPGEIFVAAVLAFESGMPERVQPILEQGTARPDLARAVISALGWITAERAKELIHPLLEAPTPLQRRVGIGAAVCQRWDPGQALRQALRDKEPLVQARALRAVGELGLVDVVELFAKHVNRADQACQFWATWTSALLTRDPKSLKDLRVLTMEPGPYQEDAVRLAARADHLPMSTMLLTFLQKEPETHRMACLCAGALGDPASIPWLLEQMDNPDLARVAGEALSTITGADFANDDLEGAPPADFEAGPSEDAADEDVAVDIDEHLPWPAPRLIETWWQENKSRFARGKRYLLGKPITEDACTAILHTGYQRHRAAAALELAIRQPKAGIFNTKAPGFRQPP